MAEENRRVTIQINGREITNNIRSISAEYRKQNRELAGLTRGSKEYQDKIKEIRRTKRILDDHRKAIRGVGKETQNATRVQGSFNSLISKGKAVFASALGPLLAITTAFQTLVRAKNVIQEFNVALDELQAITGLEGEKLEFLKDQAIETGKEVGKTGREMLEAYKLVGSAQPVLLQNEQALAAVTERAIILSQATGTDLAESVSNLTTIMNANNATTDETDRFLNVLAAGSQVGAKEVGFVAQALKNVGPGAASAGLSIEQSVSAIELFGEKGIEAARAGTQFRNILLILQQDQNNYTDGVFDYERALTNLAPIMNDATALADQFGKENVTGAQILAQNKDRLDELTEAVTGTNTAYEQAAINTDNSAAAQKRFEASLDALFLKFSEGDGLLTAFFDGAAFYLDFLGTQIDEFKVLFGGLFEEFANLLQALGIVNSETEATAGVMKVLQTSIQSTFTPLKLLIQTIRNGFGVASIAINLFVEQIRSVPQFFEASLNRIKSGANDLIDGLNTLPGVDIKSKFDVEDIDFPDFAGQIKEAQTGLRELGQDNKQFFQELSSGFTDIWSEETAKESVRAAAEDIALTAVDTAEDVVKKSGNSKGKDSKIEEEVRKAQDKIFAAINEVTSSEQEKEILATEMKYNTLLDLADKYGLDRVELEEARNIQISEINQTYRDAQIEADQEVQAAELEAINKRKAARIDFAETLYNEASSLVEIGIANAEERELEGLEERREQGLIAEEEYERQKLAIQEAAFKKKKAVDIAQALINGALAITKVVAQTGVASPFVIPTIVATTAAQIGTIAAQKFEDGGQFLVGPSHSNGGMPVLNPITGQKVAELEGREYITRKSSVNPRTMPMLRYINQHGDIPQFNHSLYQQSKYRTGGVFGEGPEGNLQASASNGPDISKVLERLLSQQAAIISQSINSQEIFIRQTTIENAESRKAKAKKFANIRA